MKDYVLEKIREEIGSDISRLNLEIKHFHAEKASRMAPAKATASERRANEVDHVHAKPLDATLTEEEKIQLEENLRGLAVQLKREGETDEQAFERVKNSKYLIAFKHDEYWPFYHVEHKFDRIILTINSAHAFFEKLYNPLKELDRKRKEEGLAESEAGDGGDGDGDGDGDDSAVVALELLLLSLARAQSVLALRRDEGKEIFDQLRREWSETYRIQLSA